MITECANCYAVVECLDDGEAYICADRDACQQRVSHTEYLYAVADSDIDFDAPRRSTARVPIFCQQCGKNGKVVYPTEDGKRKGGGHFSGPTMRLTAYLAGAPKVCQTCDRELMDAIGVFDDE